MEGTAITTDVPCVGCGYNLRMQPVAGLCTECGLAVKTSLDETILKWGSQRLRWIAWALRFQAATAILAPVTFFAGSLVDMALTSAGIGGYSQYVGVMTYGAVSMVGAAHATAAWLATSAPRGEIGRLTRCLCRLGSLALPATLFLPVVSIVLRQLSWGTGVFPALAATLLLLGWALYAERAAAWWSVFHRRAGLSAQAGLGKWSMRGFALAVAVISIGATIIVASAIAQRFGFPIIEWRNFERIENVILTILIGALALGVIFLILTIIALFRAGNRLAALAQSAKQAEPDGFTAPLATTGNLSE